MTTPVEPQVPLTTSLASVDELVLQARRLGLIWSLRPATVVNTTYVTLGAYEPRVQMDADVLTAAIPVVSLAGPVAVGMRVMVMTVPPLGYYIIGIIGVSATQRFEIGSHTSHGTTITTTETVMETFTRFSALPGAAYRFSVNGALLAATTTFTQFKLRKTNTAGQILSTAPWFTGQGIVPANMFHESFFRNTGTTTVTSNLVLTAVTLASTSTWYADAGLGRYVSIQYAGPAVEYPTAVGIV